MSESMVVLFRSPKHKDKLIEKELSNNIHLIPSLVLMLFWVIVLTSLMKIARSFEISMQKSV